MMRWLITGGCGFLGSALVARLVAEGGHSIRVLDNLGGGSSRRLGAISGYRETSPGDVRAIAPATSSTANIELVVGDVRDAALCLRAAEGADVIVHLAAPPGRVSSLLEPRFDCETNMGGTLNMLEAARHSGAARIVVGSGNDANGEFRRGANRKSEPAPISPRGAAQLASEGYCSAYFRSFDVPALALRLGNLYGPGGDAGVIDRFVRGAQSGERLDIHGDGLQTRDFVYIDDAVDALMVAATGDVEAGRTYQVSSGEETCIVEAVDLLRRLARHADWPAAQIGHTPAPAGSIGHGYPGAAGMPPLPGWAAETGFATGLARTVRWAMDHPEKSALAA